MRTIDKRKAAVAGIDLEHSLNYIMASDVGNDFIYDKYTAGRAFYRKGSRPRLEKIVEEVTNGVPDQLEGIRRLCRWVVDHIPHAIVYMKKTGVKLPPDRALTEEELIDSGYGWCNEQARIFCSLAQIYGVPSRLAFIFMPPGQPGGGHVISEVLLPEGWLAVDQSLCLLFINRKGEYIRAVDVYNVPENREDFAEVYFKAREPRRAEFGREILELCSAMTLVDNPLMAFTDVGFHNYYIH